MLLKKLKSVDIRYHDGVRSVRMGGARLERAVCMFVGVLLNSRHQVYKRMRGERVKICN